MKDIALVILAAGIGSRYGQRIKQLEPVGPNGELLMDYSIYDAMAAGFTKVVFIIRRDIEQLVRDAIGDRISKHIKVEYVFQSKEDLPVRKELAETRVKPWGTSQAILCARDAVDGPFAVINADDYYGTDSYKVLYEYLKNADNSGRKPCEFSLVGFRLKNTLSDNGTVTRGICSDDNGCLTKLHETKQIKRCEDGVIRGIYGGEELEIDENSSVSMNMWGFTKECFDILSEQFVEFLNNVDKENNTDEFLLPISVDEMIRKNAAEIKLLTTDSKWFGVTYVQDKPLVEQCVLKCIEDGVYPNRLWS